jgi:GGDEF domain-containing protein
MAEHSPIKKISHYGTFVFLDLDRFHNCIDMKGWSEYKPNPISGFLTEELEKYVRKYRGLIIWGLDKHRGTEEAILFFYQNSKIIYELFENIRQEIKRLAEKLDAPTSLSIGMVRGPAPSIKRIKSHNKKEFKKDPHILMAYRALKKAKKNGGNCIVQF